MKIPFDIKYRPQIESGEYKVETRDGRKARIIHWDLNCTSPIVAVMDAHIDLPGEIVDVFSVSGRAFDDLESPSDLFIVTLEEEMTPFEDRLAEIIVSSQGLCTFDACKTEAKRYAAELFALARYQFIKDGYVIEKKAFHDAVEKVAPEVMKEVSDKVDMEEALRLGYEKGRADALKDLPRWKKCDPNSIYNTKFNFIVNGVGRYIVLDGYMINVDRLEKLPGFNE